MDEIEQHPLKWYDEPSISIEDAIHQQRVREGTEECVDPECSCNWREDD